MGCSVIPIVNMFVDNVMLLKYWAPISTFFQEQVVPL